MQRKSLPRDQCALFKVQSPRRLAEQVLRIGLEDLHRLARGGAANYEVYEGKDSGRWIESPSEELKKVQRRIHNLLAQITPPEFLYSGVRGRSAVGNAVRHFERHQKAVPVVKLDITKFYPSSDGERVGQFFYQAMQCSREVAKLVCGLTTIPATSASTHLHLPTGGVTSQILAYYSYQAMFDALASLAAKSNTVLSVLVDDITFSGAGATPGLLNEARQVVHRFGLCSKRKKEKVLDARCTKIVTGVALTGQGPRLSHSHRKVIHQLQERLNEATAPEERAVLARRLFGALSHAGQIEPRYREQRRVLHRKLPRQHITERHGAIEVVTLDAELLVQRVDGRVPAELRLRGQHVQPATAGAPASAADVQAGIVRDVAGCERLALRLDAGQHLCGDDDGILNQFLGILVPDLGGVAGDGLADARGDVFDQHFTCLW